MIKMLRGKKAMTLLLAVVMALALCVPAAFAAQSAQAGSQTGQTVQQLQQAVRNEEALPCTGTWVTVRILGYDAGNGGVILKNYRERLTDSTGYTVLDALEKACADNNISYTASGSGATAYVSEIGGQREAYFQPNELYYSGWMYRVWQKADQPANPQNDVLPWDSAGAYTLGSGDKVTWYYAIPAESWYTIMANYSSIKPIYRSGQTINVSVQGQKYEDVLSWTLLPFSGLEDATVVLTRAGDNRQLASTVTDENGAAALQVPKVKWPTLCYISVQGKYFDSDSLAGGIAQTDSWSKPVIVW